MSRHTTTAIMLALLSSIATTPAPAGTTTADFLTWEQKAQESFLTISISMAGVIASQTEPKVAECLNDWYYKGDGLQNVRNREILDIMPKYAEHDPSVVVLAYIEGICGEFERSR